MQLSVHPSFSVVSARTAEIVDIIRLFFLHSSTTLVHKGAVLTDMRGGGGVLLLCEKLDGVVKML